MSALALQKLAPIEEETFGFFRREEGLRLLYYLMQPTTTPEMAEVFREKYLENIMQDDTHRTLYITDMVKHAKENF